MPTQATRMHEAIGRAVLMPQVFEAVFVVCIELVQSLRRVSIGESSDPINPNRFKVPTANLLKELATRNDIDPDFHAQIVSLVERRHLLIHRWFLENGLPGDLDSNEIERLTALAVQVENSSRHVIALLSGYVTKWLGSEDSSSSAFAERLSRAERLFHEAHRIAGVS